MKGGGSPQASEQPSASKRNSSVWSDKTSWLSNLRSQHSSQHHFQQKLFLNNMQKYKKRYQDTDPDDPPVKLPARKVAIVVKEKLKEELDRLGGLKIVTPVNVLTP